eukprot:8130-Heterococcus_DN1.PRE.2
MVAASSAERKLMEELEAMKVSVVITKGYIPLTLSVVMFSSTSIGAVARDATAQAKAHTLTWCLESRQDAYKHCSHTLYTNTAVCNHHLSLLQAMFSQLREENAKLATSSGGGADVSALQDMLARKQAELQEVNCDCDTTYHITYADNVSIVTPTLWYRITDTS